MPVRHNIYYHSKENIAELLRLTNGFRKYIEFNIIETMAVNHLKGYLVSPDKATFNNVYQMKLNKLCYEILLAYLIKNKDK